MAGRFVTFEGGEGVGKSTQVARLAERLRARGDEVVATREPGGSPRAERLREAVLSGAAKPMGPLAETILIASARADHVETAIRPALQRGAWVLCDRFVDSTRAYQGALGGVDRAAIMALEQVATGGRMPDLTLILDAPAETGLARARRRSGEGASPDRFEAEDLEFHQRLRRAFADIARANPKRCVVIAADAPTDEVADRIWAVVSERYGLAAAPSESPA
jgi:dTMP kinase